MIPNRLRGVPDIPGYAIRGVLGEGGFCTVYEAIAEGPSGISAPVAIKVLQHEATQTDPAARERFQRETILLSRVRSEIIVKVYESGVLEDGRPYLVMEVLEGTLLRELLDQRGAVEPIVAARMAEKVATALVLLHEMGVIHRDLKPENIMVTEVRGELVPKLLDFGLVRGTDEDGAWGGLTARGSRIGTPACMAPEYLQSGAVSPATDLYSLGMVLWHSLAGSVPFGGDLRNTYSRKLRPLPSIATVAYDIPPSLVTLVDSLVQPDPLRRPVDAAEVASALREIIRDSEQPWQTASDGPTLRLGLVTRPREASDSAPGAETHLLDVGIQDDMTLRLPIEIARPPRGATKRAGASATPSSRLAALAENGLVRIAAAVAGALIMGYVIGRLI